MDALLGNIPNDFLPFIVVFIALLAFFCIAVPAIRGANMPCVRRRAWCKRHQRWANIQTALDSKRGKVEVVGCDIQTAPCDEECVEKTDA